MIANMNTQLPSKRQSLTENASDSINQLLHSATDGKSDQIIPEQVAISDYKADRCYHPVYSRRRCMTLVATDTSSCKYM